MTRERGEKVSRFKSTFRLLQRLTEIFFCLLLVTLLIYAGDRLYRHLQHSPIFKVETVDITGNHTLTKSDLMYYLGLNKKPNLLGLPIEALYKKLIAHPWIKDATIHRNLPGTLSIHIDERVPVALIMIDRLYYVDQDGAVFAKINKDVGCDFPIFTGPRRSSQLSAYQPLINEAIPLITERTAPLISEIHLDLTRGITLITLQDAIPVRLGRRDLSRRLHRFLAVYHYLRRREIVTRAIDCRYPDRVVVKYAPFGVGQSSSGGKA